MRLLIMGLCCWLLLGCERSEERRADDCGDAAVVRLGLLAEDPQAPCRYSVTLVELDGVLYYELTSMLCFVEPKYYYCDGSPECTGLGCTGERFRDARRIRFLGWLPDPSDCAAGVIERLGLSPEVPDVDCPNQVTQYVWRGEFYYLVANVVPNCNSVDIVYTCEGERACVLAPGNDCAADWQETAYEIGVLGYY